MESRIRHGWSWHGTIGRGRYVGTGLVLLGLKHNIDRLIAAAFGYPWSLFNYLVFDSPNGIEGITPRDATFFGVLLMVALPFIWIGTVLTLRRLRDIDWPLWLVFLFFLPFLNVIFFAILGVIPSTQQVDRRSDLAARIGRVIPESEFGSAVFGIVFTALLAAVEAAISASGLANYGWGLFVGVPFFLGLNSTLIYSFHRPRPLGRCLLVAVLSSLLVGLALLAFAIEGILCLAMAVPLAVAIALFGGFIGWVIQRRISFQSTSLRVVSLGVLLIPGLTVVESVLGGTPQLHAVKTSVVINSDPETVWSHVISFSQLPPPDEAMFKTGIAYPIRAHMCGQGVGAVRHCVFSTGPFVEPITVWDEPRLLRFDVTEQPKTMEEWSPYNDLHPPHLDSYLIVSQGQFELKPLPDGTTLLEGTTWYRNKFWPAPYWYLWSDHIINGIHKRVLLHIKTLAESK